MSRIAATFARLRAAGRGALMPFVTAGDPTPALGLEVVRAVVRGGADLIELGFPYSDPLADGPTIQRSSQRALGAGMRLDRLFEIAATVRGESDIPIVLMTYFNPVYHHGVERYLARAKAAGVDGLILPDLPPDEGAELFAACREIGIDPIPLLAPTSTEDRIKLAVAAGRGFLYYVSLTGVTGTRAQLAADLRERLGHLRRFTDLPVAVGFGVATSAHVAEVCALADGAIVGSALVQVIEANGAAPDLVAKVTAFVAELATGTRRRGGAEPGGEPAS
ncbi:MAG: tryptophan synthase subunit alpha [Deltaproteobacteria bacterium]|nr:tryptophan synthase subunit alpha [Deltaproteobacteria bacterium]NCP95585.1 tryptophan synthase subunit alpha [Deltaproteobacteria bacterium]NCS74374.1 tryptophan synthase subunit alpha [Deltaproteobacteria bacterium]PIU79090.1 MAG: tryptophan synthase subunit alpha [Nitrospirae bacterium CG06_land_8_20_14_3_00_70_43]